MRDDIDLPELDDIDLPELYALLIGMSRVGAYAQLDHAVRTRALGVIFDGLTAPRPAS